MFFSETQCIYEHNSIKEKYSVTKRTSASYVTDYRRKYRRARGST